MTQSMKTKREVNTKRKHKLEVPITEFKFNAENGEFTCYANVKNVIDHAGDRTVAGAFKNTIERHMSAGTMPLMLWMHDAYQLPVGVWIDWMEDDKGLRMRGKLAETTMGSDLEKLAKMNAVNKFSIGYYVIDGEWNDRVGSFDLKEVDVVEVSWVTFACNEESTLEDIKTSLEEGGTLTKSELRELLMASTDLGRNAINRITKHYTPPGSDASEEDEPVDVLDLLMNSELFQ